MSRKSSLPEVSDPYKNTDLDIELTLSSEKLLTQNFINEIKHKLNRQVKGRCNNHGFVKTINRINYDQNVETLIQNEIVSGDLTGRISCAVSFNAELCVPKPGDIFRVKIMDMFPGLVMCDYDEIIQIIVEFKNKNYNKDVFEFESKFKKMTIKSEKRFLNIDDAIYVRIRTAEIKNGAPKIICTAELENVYIK